MKKLFTLMLFVMAFLGTSWAQSTERIYLDGLNESYSFLNLNDNASITSINNNCIRAIAGGASDYSSWYDWKYRFKPEDLDNSWRVMGGDWGGFLNKSGSDKKFTIVGLHDGDMLYIEPAADNGAPAGLTFVSDNIALGVQENGKWIPQYETGHETQYDDDGNPYEVEIHVIKKIESGHKVSRTERYFVIGGGDVDINVPGTSNTRVQRVDITSWNEAKSEVVDGTIEGVSRTGKKFHFTEAGILKDKNASIPYITMKFGADKDLTYLQRYGSIGLASHTKNSQGGEYVEFENGGSSSATPKSGSYYYFFPDVNGTLYFKGHVIDGNQGDLSFIDKSNNTVFVMFNGSNTSGSWAYNNKFNSLGSNNIEVKGVPVEKGHIYYISSNGYNPDQHPFFALSEYIFVPDASIYSGPLYFVSEPGEQSFTATTTANHGLTGASVKECLGNVASATVSVNNGMLVVSNVVFKSKVDGKDANPGGVILVRMNPSGNFEDAVCVVTIPYKAEAYANKETKQIKVWDFYTNSLYLGKSTDTNSLLYKEMHKADGSKDWEFDYMNHYTNTEPVFKSVWDMDYDNADMIRETEGLLLKSNSNEVCIYNELDPNPAKLTDRYVGLLKNATLTIPKLQAGDRVRILMDRYGGPKEGEVKAVLTVTNGRDVSLENDGTEGRGKLITTDYVIGGAGNRISGGKCVIYGDYNFIVDHSGDFSIKMKDGKLLKLYRIEIYRNPTHVTNNAVLQSYSTYEVLYTDKSSTTQTMNYVLHDHGKGERIKVLRLDNVNMFNQSGNRVNVSFTENTPGAATAVSYVPQKGDFGSFRMMLGNKTLDSEYITDRAERTMAVGYRETKKYPYTWDFTDLSEYTCTSSDGKDAIISEILNTNIIDDAKRWKIIDGAAGLREAPDEQTGILFARGGQLYGSNKMFAETAGLGFDRITVADPKDLNLYNGSVKVVTGSDTEEGGLILDCLTEGKYHKIIIPEVDADAAVYVRATLLDGAATSDRFLAHFSTDGTNGTKFEANNTSINVLNADGDKIYVVKNTGTKRDMELWLNGMKVKKIAVSTDPKSVNIKGYASESRNHAIDASLTSYFTGKDMKTYLVSNPDYSKHTIALTDVGASDNYVIPAGTGCVIFNSTDKDELKILNDKFHLFVPDMHDQTDKFADVRVNNGFMIPVLEQRTGDNKLKSFSSDGSKTNYVLSYKWYNLAADGSKMGEEHQSEEMFYRVSREGINLRANSAYLVLDTESLGLKTSQGSQQGTNSAKFTFVFNDWNETPSVPTSIDSMDGVETIENADVWYNLNGQRLNGRPVKGGIYILNGRKTLVK